ncbi:MAG: hypothetical protein BRD50_04905, partial [Bacteroidetes bacterium SW_11_45_7]
MGTFSGSSIPKQVTSSGGEMLVRFTTDGSGTAQGWNGTYNCSTGGGIFDCVPPQPTGNPGLSPDWTQLSCIERGKPYSAVINFENKSKKGTLTIDSLRLDSVGVIRPQDTLDAVADFNGPPSGINFTTSNGTPTNIWGPSETGCIEVTGTTNDSVGNYQVGFWVKIWVENFPQTINDQLFSYTLKVRQQGSPCKDTLSCPPLTINANIQDVTSCDSTNGSISVTASGGTPPYSYQWSNGQNGATISGLPSGSYTVTVTDSSNCMGTSTETISVVNGTPCVWPGDANNDGIVNNTDLLSIGTAHGSTGPARANISTLWEPKSATPWSKTFSNGVNYTFADCNGDGTINGQDTMAINQNYSKTHNKTSGGNNPNSPPVSLDMPDSVLTGQIIQVPVQVGSANQPINALYGTAFTVQFNNNIIEPNSVRFEPNASWLGAPGDLLFIDKEITASSQLDIALTRTDQQNSSGNGAIGHVKMKVKDNINTSGGVSLDLSVTSIRAITANEANVPLQGNTSSASVYNSTGIGDESALSSLQIYPNPA